VLAAEWSWIEAIFARDSLEFRHDLPIQHSHFEEDNWTELLTQLQNDQIIKKIIVSHFVHKLKCRVVIE
jgi:hypothetical protein